MQARSQHPIVVLVEEVLNLGRRHLIEDLASPHHILHDNDGDLYGPDGLHIAVMDYRIGFPDLELTTDDFVVHGNWAACRISLRGTHAGRYRGYPPSGSTVTLTGIIVARVTTGRLEESWMHIDASSLTVNTDSQPERRISLNEPHPTLSQDRSTAHRLPG